MARKKRVPKYCHHKATNQAYVRIQGKCHYLGVYDSEESHARYKRLMIQLLQKPDSKPVGQLDDTWKETNATVSKVCLEYFKHAQDYFQNSGRINVVRSIIKGFRGIYGDLLASQFTRDRFKEYRQSLIDRKLSRFHD